MILTPIDWAAKARIGERGNNPGDNQDHPETTGLEVSEVTRCAICGKEPLDRSCTILAMQHLSGLENLADRRAPSLAGAPTGKGPVRQYSAKENRKFSSGLNAS
jgi:hypothetical protein